MAHKIQVFILNYNGEHLLKQCLPSILSCAASSTHSVTVSVIDNSSTDHSVAFLRASHPEVPILSRTNRGLVSFNTVVEQSDCDVAVLMNNDVSVSEGCFDSLLDPFRRHKDCFMSSPLCWKPSGEYEGTLSQLLFRRGLFRTELAASGHHKPGITASAGAILAVQRSRFIQLGGFDPLFLPGRYEDLDLAYRAYQAGWKAYYVPHAVAHHIGAASFGPAFGKRGMDVLDARNSLLFAWKHLSDSPSWFRHLGFLGLRLCWSTFRRTSLLKGFGQAIRHAPMIRRTGTAPLRSQREILKLLGPLNS